MDPREDRGHHEALYFPDHDRARAAVHPAGEDREATKAVAAGGNLNPAAGEAAGDRSWRRGRADPCPGATAREEGDAAAGLALAVGE